MSRPAIDDAATLDELRRMMALGCRRSTALATIKRNSGGNASDVRRWRDKLRRFMEETPN